MDANHEPAPLTPHARVRHVRGWAGRIARVDADRVVLVPDDDRDDAVWCLATDLRAIAPAWPRYLEAVRVSITAPLTASEWKALGDDLTGELIDTVRLNEEGPEAEATIARYHAAQRDCYRRRNAVTPAPVYGALAIDHPERRPTGAPEVTRWNASTEAA